MILIREDIFFYIMSMCMKHCPCISKEQAKNATLTLSRVVEVLRVVRRRGSHILQKTGSQMATRSSALCDGRSLPPGRYLDVTCQRLREPQRYSAARRSNHENVHNLVRKSSRDEVTALKIHFITRSVETRRVPLSTGQWELIPIFVVHT